MKKTLKYISALLCVLMTAGCCTTAFTAAELNEDESVKAIYQKNENGASVYYDENGNELPIEALNDDSDNIKQSLPEKYDLRDSGRVSKVKNQGSEGYCWAFGSVASMESNILTQSDLRTELGDNPQDSLDISEAGQIWYIHTGVTDKNSPFYGDYMKDPDKGSNGGSTTTLAQSLNSGFGTYPQQLCPYEDVKRGFSETLRFYSDYRLREYNELSNEPNLLKSKIMNDGAITVFYDSVRQCYSSDYKNYYSDENSPLSTQGHIIAVVGWDDNYSKENFTGYSKPEHDGAWLCKNSWGESYGNNGYIWISYDTIRLSFSQYIMQSNKNFDNIYQKSFLTSGLGYNYDGAANVFTANSDEQLKQISISTMGAYDYTISVYALDADFAYPKDGKLLTTFTGKIENNGIHYIDVPKEVYLSSGEKFSVVIEANDNDSFLNFSSNSSDNIKYEPKNSYTFSRGAWKDITENTADAQLYAGIKAFTSNIDNSFVINSLKSAITDAEKFDKTTADIPYYADLLTEQITKAKAVLENRNSSAQDMNNQIILLSFYQEKAINAPYEINSVDDYIALTELCTNYGLLPDVISLNTDLDLKNYTEGFDPICNGSGEFMDTFLGNNHTIKNIRFKQHQFSNDTYSGLFGNLKCAVVSDLNIENAVVEPSSKGGVLSATANYATIKNCHISNSKIEYGYDLTIQSSGGLCGEAWYSTITNCTAEGNAIYGSTAGEFAFSVDSNILNCTAKNNKVYTTGSLTIYYPDTYEAKNLYFASDMNKSDTLVEMTDEYIRVSSLIHKITSCTSETVGLTKQGDYYYIDRKILENNQFVIVNIDMTDAENSYKYKVNLDDKSIILTEMNYEPSDTITIPSTYLGRPVTGISENIFTKFDPSEVTALVLGDNLTSLPSNLIAPLYNIESIKFGNSLKEIPKGFASYKSMLKTVNFGSGIEKIGNYAFEGCINLEGVNLTDNIKEIGNSAFIGVNFNKMTIGKSVEKIGTEAFGYFNYSLSNNNGKKVQNPYYVINGYGSTEAERYASKNGITFIDMNLSEPDTEQTYTDLFSYKAGDIDLNGVIDVNDVTLLQRFIAQDVEFNDLQYKAAAVTTHIKKITVNNVTEIQRYLSGEIDDLELRGQG